MPFAAKSLSAHHRHKHGVLMSRTTLLKHAKSTPWATKSSQLSSVCNFVKNQRMLMTLSPLDFKTGNSSGHEIANAYFLTTSSTTFTQCGLRTRVDPRNHVLDGGSDPPWEGAGKRSRPFQSIGTLCRELCKTGETILTIYTSMTCFPVSDILTGKHVRRIDR